MRTKIVPLMVFALGALVAMAGVASAQSEDPNPAVPRWTDAEYEVSIADDLDQVDLEGGVDIHEVPPENRLLERHCGTSCSADELRQAYQQAGEQEKQRLVDAMEAAVEARIEAALTGLGATNVTSVADADEASLAEPPEGDEYQPPIPIDARGSGDLDIMDDAGLTPDQVEALFAMGAKVDQGVEVDVEAGTNLTLALAVPSPLEILATETGQPSADGSQVTWVEDNWQGTEASSIEDQVRIGDPSVEVPTSSDAEVDITLDISDVGVEYGALVGGGGDQPAQADVAIDVDGSFRSIENPRDVDRVHLPYLSADAIRIALEHDLLPTSRLVGLEDSARQRIESTFEGMTDEDVEVRGGFPAGTLSTDAIGDPHGTGGPVELAMDANATVAFPPEQQTAGAQGFTVTTLSMGTFELPQLDVPYDVDTTTTIVLPNGVDLAFDEPAGYDVTKGERDGRAAYTFTANGDGNGSQQAAIQNGEIVVNHPFVWDVFWPLLVALALLLVVLPAVVIGLTIRRRRKHGPPSAGESAKPVSGSQATQRETGGDE